MKIIDELGNERNNSQRIVLPDFGSHYYMPDGTPFYEVPNLSKPGQMRAARVDDARKAGALPSVTTILGMVNKYALAAWKEEQYILAGARTLRVCAECGSSYLTPSHFPTPDEKYHVYKQEDDLAFCRRIRDEGRAEAIAAAEFGTRVHEAIAQLMSLPDLSGSSWDLDALPFAIEVDKWRRTNDLIIIETERCFADVEQRYGGRIDCVGTLRGEPVVIDWQTSKTMVTYPEKYAQVVAYKRGLQRLGNDQDIYYDARDPGKRLRTIYKLRRPLIVTISSVTPGLIEEHELSQQPDHAPTAPPTEAEAWDVFADAKRLYYGAAGPWKQAT